MIRQNEVSVWIENQHPYGRCRIYVYSDYAYYTIKDGMVIENSKPEGCSWSLENTHLLECPIWFADIFSEAVSKYLSQRGGIIHEQLNKGIIKRLENETDWLRELIKGQLK